MRFTPLDLRNHSFTRRLRGYDRTEVDGFLQLVADDYEALVLQVETLERRLREAAARRTEMEAAERSLREAIVSTQAASQELKQNAQREADLLIGKTEIESERILEAAERSAAQLEQDIRELRQVRRRLGTALRCEIERHLATVDDLTREEGRAPAPARRAASAGLAGQTPARAPSGPGA